MRQMIGFAVFATFFVALCGVCNFYILWRFTGFFGVRRKRWFWLVLVALTLSYVLSIGIDELFSNAATTFVQATAALWLGIALLLVSALLVYELLRLVIKIPPRLAGISIAIVVLTLTVCSMINARRVVVKVVEIEAPVEMNIVQLSDIHLGSDGHSFLEHIVEKTNTLSPDVVLLTGDVVDPHSGIGAEEISPLNDIEAPVFFVTGNHEGYAGVGKIMDLLRTTKVRTLRNEAVDFGEIQIIGIDDSNRRSQVADQLKRIEFDDSKYCVLMYHRPRGFEAAAENGVDLMLTGHTHNGQIAPFNLIVGLAFKHMSGLYRHEGSYLYVTTGTGTWGPRMRLGSSNEIVLLKLRK